MPNLDYEDELSDIDIDSMDIEPPVLDQATIDQMNRDYFALLQKEDQSMQSRIDALRKKK